MFRSLSLAGPIALALLASACPPPPNNPPGGCAGRLPGDLVITEFLADPAGADEGKEYLEIFNAGSTTISLVGITLKHSRADGSAEKKTTLKKGSLEPGQYYALGDVQSGDLPGHLDDTYLEGLGALNNSAGVLAVLCGTVELDVVKYSASKENAARIFDGSRFPDGVANDDESLWCNATTQAGGFLGSPRAANASCQDAVCSGRSPGDLVITEVLPDPTGADDGKEYLEIFNTTGASIDLNGMTLTYVRADGSGLKTTPFTSGTVPSRKYFTVGDSKAVPLPPHVDLSYGAGLGALSNIDGRVSISCGPTVIDEMIYTRVKGGSARVLDGNLAPDATLNDDEANWCDAKVAFDDFWGSPRAANEACGSTTAGCVDPATSLTRAPRAPRPGKLIVSEVMADPFTPQADREWFELYATEAMDLNGVKVQVSTTSGAQPNGCSLSNCVTINPEQCLPVAAGSYVVLSRNLALDVNGGIASPIASFPFPLPTGPRSLFVSHQGTLIDVATYPGNTTSQHKSVQLSADRLEDWVNDSEYAWCDGEVSYGAGGKGTPGAQNRLCPSPVAPGECSDPDGGVRDINRPDAGTLAFTEVMPAPFPLPAAVAERPKEWFELYAVGAVDLNEVEFANELGSKDRIGQKGCFAVRQGEHLLFSQTVDTTQNGGLPPPRFVFSFDLTNSGSVIVRSQGVELDRMSWTTSTVGASVQLGGGVPPSPSANDLAQNLCDAPAGTEYGDGGDRGTPGAANLNCP